MIGVKELLKSFEPKVDWDKRAKTKAKEEGVSVDDIRQEWEEARDKGHAKGKILNDLKNKEYDGQPNYIFTTYKKSDESFIYNPEDYILKNGFIYDEKPFVDISKQLIGIPDRIEVIDNKVYITDFKSDKEIYLNAYLIKNGKFTTKQKFLAPIQHLDKCNYNFYAMQLGLYMHLVLHNNKTLRFGGLKILHTRFNEDTLEPGEETPYNVPYFRIEVQAILKSLK